jgi:hypothetical protein
MSDDPREWDSTDRIGWFLVFVCGACVWALAFIGVLAILSDL